MLLSVASVAAFAAVVVAWLSLTFASFAGIADVVLSVIVGNFSSYPVVVASLTQFV